MNYGEFKELDAIDRAYIADAWANSTKESTFDPVTKPSHYNQKGIECIQAIEASMSPIEFQGYLKGNSMKYLWRFRYKGKMIEDLEKGNWYQALLIEKLKEESSVEE